MFRRLLTVLALGWVAASAAIAGPAPVHRAEFALRASPPGSFEIAQINLLGVGAGFSYSFPTPVLALEMGDSRVGYGESITRTSTFSITSTFDKAYPVFNDLAINHAVLKSGSYAYGIPGTTSLNAYTRLTSSSVAATGNTVANGATGDAFDVNFNANSSGGTATTTRTPLTDPANIVFFLDDTNDRVNTGGTKTAPCYLGGANAGCYSSTEPRSTFSVNLAILDAWHTAGKIVFLDNETPLGGNTVINESHACASCLSVTATNTANFVDSPDFVYAGTPLYDQTGAVWTRVANLAACSAAAKTYWVNSSGVYTFCLGITVPTTAYVSYAYGTSTGGPTTYLSVTSAWLSSSSASFTAALGGYVGPGALYGRSDVVPVDSWGALADPATSSTLAYAGTMVDTIHSTILGEILHAAAYRTAWLATYPTYTAPPALAKPPTLNNWWPCYTNATANQTLSNTACGASAPGVLSGSMLTNCATNPPALAISGAIIATGSGGTFTGSGVSSGSYNCGTGAWTATLNYTPGNLKPVELIEDPVNFVDNALGETQNGTIGVGVGLAGQTGTPPNGWKNTSGGSGGVATCLGGTPTCTLTETRTTCTDPTWGTVTCEKYVLDGVLPASGNFNINFGQNDVIGIGNKIVAGTVMRAGVTIAIGPGASGHTYNVRPPALTASQTTSVAYTPGYQSAASTTTLSTVQSGGPSAANGQMSDSAVSAWIAKFPSSMSNGGTAMVLPIVTPAVDTTGFTEASVTASPEQLTFSFSAGPVSATFYVWRPWWRTGFSQ